MSGLRRASFENLRRYAGRILVDGMVINLMRLASKIGWQNIESVGTAVAEGILENLYEKIAAVYDELRVPGLMQNLSEVLLGPPIPGPKRSFVLA